MAKALLISAMALALATLATAAPAGDVLRIGKSQRLSPQQVLDLDLEDLMGQEIVTATRRRQRMQDIPLSLTAFTQELMDRQGLRTIDDLAQLVPGVTFQRHGVGASANYNDENSNINLRGIDSSAGAATVAIYIDDTPIQTRHIGYGAVNAFPARRARRVNSSITSRSPTTRITSSVATTIPGC